MAIRKIGGTATAVVALGAFLAAAPVGFDFGGHAGIGLGTAFAKDGNNGNGNGGGNNGKGGGNNGKGGGNNGNGGGNSGNGGGNNGNGGGNSGGNSGNGGGDDIGGRGNSDRGGGNGRGGDDRGGDDRGARAGDDGGGGGDDEAGAVRGGGAVAAPGESLRVVKIERSASGVEVIYSNSVREAIENGRYELKDASGRTALERAATEGDFERIGRNARNSGLTASSRGGGGSVLPAGSQARSVEVSGRGIEVRYVTGWRETVEGDRYELKDPNNNTVVERPATTDDRDRMLALAGG